MTVKEFGTVFELNLMLPGAVGGLIGYLGRRIITGKGCYGKDLLRICMPEILIGAALGNFLARSSLQNSNKQLLMPFLFGVLWRPVFMGLPRMAGVMLGELQSQLSPEVQEILQESDEKDRTEHKEWLEQVGKTKDMSKMEE